MRIFMRFWAFGMFMVLAAIAASSSYAQQYKMTTPIAPGVAVPDKIESSIGTLKLSDGYPDSETANKIYDNLDHSRALQAYLLAIPIVNQAGMRDSIRKFGPDNQTDVIWEHLVDSKTVELTANDNTVYSFVWLDTKKGALVLETTFTIVGSPTSVLLVRTKEEAASISCCPPATMDRFPRATLSCGLPHTETGCSSGVF